MMVEGVTSQLRIFEDVGHDVHKIEQTIYWMLRVFLRLSSGSQIECLRVFDEISE